VDREDAHDAGVVEALADRAFGPGRFAKTAERIREGSRPVSALSFVARARDGSIVGTVRVWPILIGETAALFLGPIAVDDAWRDRGVGAGLMDAVCSAVDADGGPPVLLVGDAPYFGKFGFRKCDAVLPGPVDPDRVLVRSAGRETAGVVRKA
jgi:predicted N-acetyltransferase YhbS